MDGIKEQLEQCNAGCSALSWKTEDGKHLWGRNFDYNRLAEGSMVTYVPRNTKYYTCGTSLEDNLVAESCRTAAYAAVGMGLMQVPSTPILYEGINEKGLMGGQLYYREFAHYAQTARANTCPLQPPFVVYHFLAQCATVEEVADRLEREFTLTAIPMFGTVPPLHWSFSDRTGESIVIEPDRDGVHIYRRTLGVMANSPSYLWHRLNLLNYAGIRDLDYDGLELNGERLEQCFSGSGAQGMPGDWSSPSRFVRLAFLREHCVKGKSEEEGIAYMLHLFQSAAFPLGMVRVSDQGHVTQFDKDPIPFDYTVYTSAMCAESLRYYWTTYENQRVQFVDLHHLLAQDRPRQFELGRNADFLCLTEEK